MTEDKSGYIQQQEAEAQSGPQGGLKKAQEVMHACYDLIETGSLPPLGMVNKIGSYSHIHYVDTMVHTFHELVMRAYLETNSNILDIGCGCGRLGSPFSLFLEEGQYFGMDVWQEGIQWCQQNITPTNPNAQFHYVPAANDYYYERGDKTARNTFRLDFCENRSIDLSFAISVFTHLLQEDARQYLDETRRVLKRDGMAYYTCFIIDEYFHRYVEDTGNHTAVKHHADGVFYAYQGQDFFAGYTMQKWLEMLDNSGLKMISHELGRWANKPGGRQYQDTFIIMRQ